MVRFVYECDICHNLVEDDDKIHAFNFVHLDEIAIALKHQTAKFHLCAKCYEGFRSYFVAHS